MKYPLPRVMFSTCICLIWASLAAAAPPDAGTLLQEQRQPGTTLPDRLPEKTREIVTPPAASPGPKVLVKSFRFTGHEGIATEAELQEPVKPSIGKELSFSELQQLTEQVTNYLREKKGFLLARAYLPKQDITAGSIEIAIVAGRIGKVRIDLKQPARIRQSILQDIADRAVPEDSAARMDRIERAVLLMNDLPGINAQASLEPGEKTGSTRIVVNAAEGNMLHGTLSGDNYGDSYTGASRGTGTASAFDPFGVGDLINLSLTGAENMLSWRAGYAIPLTASGLTVALSYTGLSYELGKDLADLKAKGRADTVGGNLSYPVLRSRRASMWTGLGFEYLALTDEANDAKTRDRKLSVGNINLSGSFFDGFGGGGLTSVNVVIYGGDVNLRGIEDNRIADAAGPGTEGGFVRGTYSLDRLQRVARQLALFGSVRGQFPSGNLDSSQKFILGGPTGVRAYPVGEAPADEGHAATVEARLDIPFMPVWAVTQLVGFFDTGWVKLHKQPWPGSVTNAADRNEYWLSGGGVGINVGKPGLYGLRASYAHTVGTNDGRSVSGNNADGLADSGRFWMQLVIWF